MDIDPARNVDWEVRIPFVKPKICSLYEENIPMYDVIFKDIGFRVPFLDFQKEVFKWLKLAPSHFHPNLMAFIMAFEMMWGNLNLNLNIAFFFLVLNLQRGMDHDGGKIWVSLKQNTQFFNIITNFIRGFKDKYFAVRPITWGLWTMWRSHHAQSNWMFALRRSHSSLFTSRGTISMVVLRGLPIVTGSSMLERPKTMTSFGCMRLVCLHIRLWTIRKRHSMILRVFLLRNLLTYILSNLWGVPQPNRQGPC